MKQTYEQRVIALATEMAKEAYGHHVMSEMCSWENFPGRRDHVKKYLPTARIAVAEMVGAIRHYDNTLIDSDPAYVERYLKERGLFPDDRQEWPAAAVPIGIVDPEWGPDDGQEAGEK